MNDRPEILIDQSTVDQCKDSKRTPGLRIDMIDGGLLRVCSYIRDGDGQLDCPYKGDRVSSGKGEYECNKLRGSRL